MKAPTLSGSIWELSSAARRSRVRKIVETLQEHYGFPRLNNPTDPVDDLVFLVISNRTRPETAISVFNALKHCFQDWAAMCANADRLESLLRPAGLSRVKSKQLVGALAKIKNDFDAYSLDSLRYLDTPTAQEYLTTLDGVSTKVAKCVLMYTLGRPVLPIDIHNYRLAYRLGWTRKNRPDLAHRELELLVPEEYRALFHVTAIVHGRSVCRANAPRCNECCIRRKCDWYRMGR
jgi:endonuclease-3